MSTAVDNQTNDIFSFFMSYPYQRIQQSAQTPVGHFADVRVVEGAEEPEYDHVRH